MPKEKKSAGIKTTRKKRVTKSKLSGTQENVSFVGLDEILEAIISYTQPNHKDKKAEERLASARKVLIGPKPKYKEPKRTTDIGDKMCFFMAIARDVIPEIRKRRLAILENHKISSEDKIKALKKVRDSIPIAKYARQHFHLLGMPKNADSIRNKVNEYNKKGYIFEDEAFLESYDDKAAISHSLTMEALQEAMIKRQAAVSEILTVLKKHGWPI